ncbi:Hypothetical predicted protein [Olea europaea subsp. europaea]|uniref:Uncharacterized protein n=1 Tax=Olea europaea subsp. europaea TaxID=158383 RepID=A0A8S0T6K1_OLEEU|nr:Hypothetical predicted protein [Olea europaea subsp. europaea]
MENNLPGASSLEISEYDRLCYHDIVVSELVSAQISTHLPEISGGGSESLLNCEQPGFFLLLDSLLLRYLQESEVLLLEFAG